MTIWGKLAGAAAGFMMGGPIGALLGALAGHFIVDEGLLAPDETPPLQSVAFTVGLIALAAKMAKADGVVTRDEVTAFRRLVTIPPEEEGGHVARLFDLAKQSTAGFEAYARQIRNLLTDEPDTLEDLVDGLFTIATADGAVHTAELAYLAEVAAIFGLPETTFARIEARHVVSGPRDPYRILGIAPDAADGEIKEAWRRLVRQYHPDRLIGRGVPAEFVAIATGKIAAINEAYDVLRKARGFA